jgi:hypothetical protein
MNTPGWMRQLEGVDCQATDLIGPSKSYPRLLTMFHQLRSNLAENGLLGTSRKAWSKLVSGGTANGPQLVTEPVEKDDAVEVLTLQPGEVVEVKSEDEIRRTLDAVGKNRGLGFMPEMWDYCGQRGRVFKRVEKICLENIPRTVRKMKNTVILEGAVCKGSGIGCDRACFYFWRECWLKRVPGGLADAEPPVMHQTRSQMVLASELERSNGTSGLERSDL